MRSFKNSDCLNNIPPYIGVVSEGGDGNTSKMTNPNRFPLVRITQTPAIFQAQENYPVSFSQEAIQAPPSLSDLRINIPLTTFGSDESIRFLFSGHSKYHTTPRIYVGQKIKSLIFVIWPVRHKNSLEPFLTKPVVKKILSTHFWPNDKIQVSDSFNNVFLRPRIPEWSSSYSSLLINFRIRNK